MKQKAVISWSGGKDSSLSLYELQKTNDYEIDGFLTTVSVDYNRISMHGVRVELLERQVDSLGYDLHKIYLNKSATNEEYETKLKVALLEFRERKVDTVVFGDIFLEDLREYRKKNLDKLKMKGLFPIWKMDTGELVNSFIDLGFKGVVTCVNSKNLDKSFAGRLIDKSFVEDLPEEVDPCGENGEFHSFVFDGPIFREPVNIKIGEVVKRDVFYFCDLLPG